MKSQSRKTKAGQSILQGAREALAYAKGEKALDYRVYGPRELRLRKRDGGASGRPSRQTIT